jgi:hypothetical protein
LTESGKSDLDAYLILSGTKLAHKINGRLKGEKTRLLGSRK